MIFFLPLLDDAAGSLIALAPEEHYVFISYSLNP